MHAEDYDGPYQPLGTLGMGKMGILSNLGQNLVGGLEHLDDFSHIGNNMK